MKIAFLTEMGFVGKIPETHTNMRTEFAWMHALDATHHHITQYQEINGYDIVFIIFPKGKLFLNAEGSKLKDDINPISNLLTLNITNELKKKNKKVYYIQEGPHWWFNDYELAEQIYFYNMVSSCDGIFAHNEFDVKYYSGLFPHSKVTEIPTLMIEHLIKDITPITENKIIIGGNFARWYGGFESYIVAQEFNLPIWGQSSHAKRDEEEHLVNILPRLDWIEWMRQLSKFKYAVHLMPTVAAGTFSLNCAYFGIPCIGNINVDTQRLCHPNLSIDINDLNKARKLAIKLRDDVSFYTECSNEALQNYKKYYNIETWKRKISSKL